MNYALIFAGGHGERMGEKYDVPKQFIKINEKPILIYTIEIFEKIHSIDSIVLVIPENFQEYVHRQLADYEIKKVGSVIVGGKTAMESIRAGLAELKKYCSDDSIIVVHDGVRPMISSKLVESSIENARKHGSAVSAIPCTETILLSTDGGYTPSGTLPRQQTYKGQAPQTYYFKELWDAFQKVKDFTKCSHIVDCASLFLELKKDIRMIPGEYGNVKITTPSDIALFKSYLRERGGESVCMSVRQECPDNIFDLDSILKEDMERLMPVISGEWNDKVFLVTGATGMIGRQIVLSLLSANRYKHFTIRVLAVTRNMERAEKIFQSFPERKFLQIIEWKDLPSCSSDFVIHCAAPTNSQFFVDSPVETMHSIFSSTEKILNYSKGQRCSGVIFLSSMEVYGDTSWTAEELGEEDLGSMDLTSARSSYPMAKRFAELLCHAYVQEYKLPVAVLRLAQTFGPWIDEHDQRLFAYLGRAVLNQEDIKLCSSGKTCRNYCYTADAVSALFTVLGKKAFGETFNVANSRTNCSVSEMAEMAGRIGNVKVRYEFSEQKRYRPECRVVLNPEKLLNLGWKPSYDLEEMFRRMLSSMRQLSENRVSGRQN